MFNKIKYFIRSTLLPDKLFLLNKTAKEPVLYLTFDDGPLPEVLTPLLDLLAKHDVKATFFIIGLRAQKHPEQLQQIVAAGHTLANHSYSHPNFHQISSAQQWQEVTQTNQLIKKITGISSHLFRAPQGRWTNALLMKLFKQNITAVHWSKDSMDFLKEPVEKIITRFEQNPATAGDIILFHDDNPLCIDALAILIPKWQAQGFTFNALENSH